MQRSYFDLKLKILRYWIQVIIKELKFQKIMGRTIRAFQRFRKFNKHLGVKSTRRQIPVLKRSSHHQHRQSNFYADELSFTTFNKHHHDRACKDTISFGELRNGKYHLESHFKENDKDPDCDLSLREKLQNEIQKKRRGSKVNYEDYRVAKNGLWARDLLLMAWKMLKRRG